MRIHLYNIACNNFKLNKEAYLINEVVLDGNCRDAQDKTNPTILFENVDNFLLIDDCVYDDNIEVGYSNDIDTCNYAYIEEFERFYFIANRIIRNNNSVILSFELDYLMSFKHLLKDEYLYITRRTNGNPFIIDNMIQFKANKQITKITSFDMLNNQYDFSNLGYLDENSYCIALNLVLNELITGTTMEYNIEPSTRYNANGVIPNAYPSSNFNTHNSYFFLITPRMLDILVDAVLHDDTIKSYIISIQALPFAPESYDLQMRFNSSLPWQDVDFLILGETTINFNDNIRVIKYANNDNVLMYRFNIDDATSFMDYSPYSKMMMYLPLCKEFELNLLNVRGCELEIYYYFDYISGNANITIYNSARGIIEHSFNSQFASNIELSSSNYLENNRTRTIKGIDMATSSMGSIFGGLFGGNYGGAIGASLNTLSKGLTMDLSMYDKAQSGSVSNSSLTFMPLEPYIIEINSISTFDNNDFQHYYANIGMLYNRYNLISNLNDNEHCIVADASDIMLDLNMTSNELDRFRDILEDGFYI